MAATHETSALQSAPDKIGGSTGKAAFENQPEKQAVAARMSAPWPHAWRISIVGP